MNGVWGKVEQNDRALEGERKRRGNVWERDETAVKVGSQGEAEMRVRQKILGILEVEGGESEEIAGEKRAEDERHK
ncbi:hypothetical protein KM043_016912 [Ampulex compressa]|nr:hypothetical protein KM043_016912 [Ampulex compressa]